MPFTHVLVRDVFRHDLMLGANQHESYWVFDICYNNTSEIVPTTITGDMHSINKANFAILHWFGMKLAPRFTNLQAQLEHLWCACDPEEYAKFSIHPAGRIDRELIVSEKDNIDRIVATLGLKEMSQSTLVRKLCTLSGSHRTRKAIFEFDRRSAASIHCAICAILNSNETSIVLRTALRPIISCAPRSPR